MRLFVWEKTGTEECLYETLRSDLTAARPEAFQRRCRGGTKVKEFTQSRASKPLDSGAFGPKVDGLLCSQGCPSDKVMGR